ncbi:Rv2993c-like domain-containing protein [Streptomyces gardneri]|uniref:Rv2993c-like domain-containing protein n=1 Tax=Streptomyces gardneri TaxID=66892 RepID=UPI00280C3480|nr:Rv2993c-like domain-containing protein [Streptomyces gardneri]
MNRSGWPGSRGRATSFTGASVLSADPVRGSAESTGRRVPLHEVRLLAPVSPGKIVAVGRNYADHIAELSLDTPATPPASSCAAR